MGEKEQQLEVVLVPDLRRTLPANVCSDAIIGAMSKIYVTKAEDSYRVAGTRISLDSLVYLYREGISPEGMVESYPALTLEQVHSALAYYLANQKEIDHYLARADAVAETQHQESRRSNAELTRETAADAPCESDSRLTPIWTGVFFVACAGRDPKSTYGPRLRLAWWPSKTPKFYAWLLRLAGFSSAKTAVQCRVTFNHLFRCLRVRA